VNDKKDTTIVLPEEEAGKALNGEDNEYGSNYHGHICHGKAFSIMSMLIDVIGKDCYFNIMRHILNNYGGKVLYTPDYIRLCEEFSGMKLNWFFDQWLKSNRSLSYSIENINETETYGIYTVTADICRKGRLSAPVCVTVYFDDGSCQTIFTERLLNKQTLTFTAKSKYNKIIFNPFNVYAMKKYDEEIVNDCVEHLIKDIKETSYTDPLNLSLGYYERYKKFNIEDDGMRMYLFMQLFDSRHYKECAEICFDIISANKCGNHNIANAYRWIGMCLDMMNEREKAIEVYNKALSFDEVKFGDRHDQYGLYITREWIQERLISPYVRI
jgi:tetratricopeptide (TPR) repeat protein